jgi:hypothetical protein
MVFCDKSEVTKTPLQEYIIHLRRRQSLERLRDLFLPPQSCLAEDLSSGLQSSIKALLEQASAQHDGIVAHDFLVVVDMRGAVLAKVAVDTLACKIVRCGDQKVTKEINWIGLGMGKVDIMLWCEDLPDSP